MKFKHISALLLFLTVFAFAGYSQVEDEEVQMFSVSNTRSIGGVLNVLDFGDLYRDSKTIKIEIPNNGKTELKIGKISIPEGVGVIVVTEVIKPGQKGELAVFVDPKFMKSGEFKKDVTFSTITVDDKGTIITKTASFTVKGKIGEK
jgi:hypothetical protein